MREIELKDTWLPLQLAFPLALIGMSAGYYLVPTLVLILIAIGVAMLGVLASVAALTTRRTRSDRSTTMSMCLVAFTWAAWIFLPVSDLGFRLRFQLGRDGYEQAMRETSGGRRPACAAGRECFADADTPPYIFFPFSAGHFGQPSIGVLEVPEPQAGIDRGRLQAEWSGAVCEPMALDAHFFKCIVP